MLQTGLKFTFNFSVVSTPVSIGISLQAYKEKTTTLESVSYIIILSPYPSSVKICGYITDNVSESSDFEEFSEDSISIFRLM
jgi:hypothetical protein